MVGRALYMGQMVAVARPGKLNLLWLAALSLVWLHVCFCAVVRVLLMRFEPVLGAKKNVFPSPQFQIEMWESKPGYNPW